MAGVKSTYDGYVGIMKQAVKGTAIAPTKFVRFSKEVGEFSKIDSKLVTIGGGGFYKGYAHKPLHSVEGKVSTLLFPSQCSRLLAFFMGADSVAAGPPGAGIHTMIPTRPSPYITIERGVKTNLRAERAVDCRINQIDISGKAGDLVEMDVDFVGLSSVLVATTLTDTYDVEPPLSFYDGTYTLLGGAFTRIDSFKLSLKNNVEKLQTTAVTLFDNPSQLFEATLDFEIVYDDADTNYAMINYGGALTIVNALATGTATILLSNGGAGAAQRSISFAFGAGSLVYKGISEAAPGPDPKTIKQTISTELSKVVAVEGLTIVGTTADAAGYLA